MEDGQVLDLEFRARSSGNNIGHNKSFAECPGNHFIILGPQFEGGWPIIVAVHKQSTLGPHFHSMLRPPEGLLRGVRACPGHDKGFAFCQFGCLRDDPVMFPPIERWRFTGRSRWNKIGSVFYLKLDILLQSLKIDLPFSIKGGRNCRPNPFKSFESHLPTLPFCVIPAYRRQG